MDIRTGGCISIVRLLMIQRIKNGEKPTDLLEEIKASNREFGNHDLASAFVKIIGYSSLDIIQPIWYWKRYRKSGGHGDDELDKIIIAVLKEAGII